MLKDRVLEYLNTIETRLRAEKNQLEIDLKDNNKKSPITDKEVQIKSIQHLIKAYDITRWVELDDTKCDEMLGENEYILFMGSRTYYRKSISEFDEFTLASILASEYFNYITGYYALATSHIRHTHRHECQQLLYLNLLGILEKDLPYGTKKRGYLLSIYEERYGKCTIPFPQRTRIKAMTCLDYLINEVQENINLGLCTENMLELELSIPIFSALTKGSGLSYRMFNQRVYYDVLKRKATTTTTLNFKSYEEEVAIIRELE